MNQAEPFQKQIDDLKTVSLDIETKEKRWAFKFTAIQFAGFIFVSLVSAGTWLYATGGKQIEKQVEVQGIKDNVSRLDAEKTRLIQSLDGNDKRHDAQIKAINDSYITFKAQLEALDKKVDANAKDLDRKLDLVIQLMKGAK